MLGHFQLNLCVTILAHCHFGLNISVAMLALHIRRMLAQGTRWDIFHGDLGSRLCWLNLSVTVWARLSRIHLAQGVFGHFQLNLSVTILVHGHFGSTCL